MWQNPASSDQYIKRQRKLQKKYLRELQGCLANVARYIEALQQGTKPKQIQGGWIHPEPFDVVALDQRGGGKKESGANKGKGLVEMRLYVYPHMAKETLHLITLGLKDTQSADIQFSIEYVKEITKNDSNEAGSDAKHEDSRKPDGPGS